MTKLITAMTRLSTAMALFGATQANRMLSAVGGDNKFSEMIGEFGTTLDGVSKVLTDSMDESKTGTVQKVTFVAERTVGQAVKAVASIVPPDMLTKATGLIEKARDSTANLIAKAAASVEGATGSVQSNPNVVVFVSRLLPPVAKVISLFVPGRDSDIAWQNAKNNAEIMQLVAHCGSILPPKGTSVPLGELVDKAYAQGPFPALWLVEGLGHYYADLFYEKGSVPSNVLTDPHLEKLPAKSMTMLHPGIGLAFAKRNLEKITSTSPGWEVRKAVENCVRLCRNSSRKGYTGAAFESLGLVSRTFHGLPVLRAVDEQLSALEPDLAGYLWRGAGRGVYFSLPDFIPGLHTPWRAVDMCKLEPPRDLGRRNMIAGFAWALTLVNMRTPIIMETLLKYHGEEFSENDAFSNGVMSAMIMRYDTSPDDPYIEPFCSYEPVSTDPQITLLWDRLVGGPCQRAVHEYYPVLKERRLLEEVFHYQDLGALVKRLKIPAESRRA